VFSNEAGLGTAGTVHSLVRTNHPERHALWGVWEVCVDTHLLCSISALTLLCSGAAIPYGSLPGADLWFRVFSIEATSFPVLPVFRLCLLVFGLSTVLGLYVPSCLCAQVTGLEEKHFRFLYLICAVLGCFLPTDRIWLASDLLNVLMAAPSLLSLILLAPEFAAGCEQSKNNAEKPESALARGQRKV
jgi:AGCS family alanine or glycine:cation symporter